MLEERLRIGLDALEARATLVRKRGRRAFALGHCVSAFLYNARCGCREPMDFVPARNRADCFGPTAGKVERARQKTTLPFLREAN